jgi:hypothetical protein
VSDSRQRKGPRHARVAVRAAGDRRLTMTSLRVLIALGGFAGPEGTAFPSLQTLGRATGLDRRKIPGAITVLEQLGYVTRQHRSGGASTLYRLHFATSHEQQERGEGDTSTGDGGAPAQGTGDTSTGDGGAPAQGTGDTSTGDGGAPVQGTAGDPSTGALTSHSFTSPLEQPTQQSFALHASERIETADELFEKFWNAYPLKKAKGGARIKYRAALRKADAATIYAGAVRYADERQGQDSKFTKYPTTWLHNECWADEPTPAHEDRRLANGTATREARGRGSSVSNPLSEAERRDRLDYGVRLNEGPSRTDP